MVSLSILLYLLYIHMHPIIEANYTLEFLNVFSLALLLQGAMIHPQRESLLPLMVIFEKYTSKSSLLKGKIWVKMCILTLIYLS